MQDHHKHADGRRLWQHPWGYRESFLIGFIILLGGFLLEMLTGGGISMPAWPVNIAIIIVFVIYFILIHHFVKHPVVKWLSSVPAAISSISIFTLMVLFMGFIPQGNVMDNAGILEKFGLTHVTSSWTYLLTAMYLLVVLGFTIIRRLKNFSIKNIAFLLNHTGLWIVVVAASLGSADMWRLSMQLKKDHPVMTAYDSRGQAYDMGMGMLLLDFSIEAYPPEIGLMRNRDYTLKLEKGGKLAVVAEGQTAMLDGYRLSFDRYIENARKYGETYDSTGTPGGVRAVHVTVTGDAGKEVARGWVSDGNFALPPAFLKLNDELSLAMTQIRPKKYSSDIRVYRSMDDYEDIYIEVNQPAKIDGWKVYQTGYDERRGRWSETSIIELVRDPWLPVVYTGIFMILIGTLYLLWMGKGRTKTKKS